MASKESKAKYLKNKPIDDIAWKKLTPFIKSLERYYMPKPAAVGFKKHIHTQFVRKPAEEHNPRWKGYWTPQIVKESAEFRYFDRDSGDSKDQATLPVLMTDCGYVFVVFLSYDNNSISLQNEHAFDWVRPHYGDQSQEMYDMHVFSVIPGAIGKIRLRRGVRGGCVMRVPKYDRSDPALPQPSASQLAKERLLHEPMSDFEKNKVLATDDNEWKTLEAMIQSPRMQGEDSIIQADKFKEVVSAIFIEAESLMPLFTWSAKTILEHAQFRLFETNEGTGESLPIEATFDCFIVPFLTSAYVKERHRNMEPIPDGFEMVIHQDEGEKVENLFSFQELSAGTSVVFRLKDGVHVGFIARIPNLKEDNKKRAGVFQSITEQLIQRQIAATGRNIQISPQASISLPTKDGTASTKDRKCHGCGIVWKKTMSKCSRCSKARYCSRTCQVGHWKDHKDECRKTAANSVP